MRDEFGPTPGAFAEADEEADEEADRGGDPPPPDGQHDRRRARGRAGRPGAARGRASGGAPRATATRVVLTLLALAGVATVLRIGSHAPSSATPPAPTPAPTAPIATPVSTLAPGLGWIPAGPPDATAITFAPGAPDIGYSCGAARPSSQDAPAAIRVYESGDRGATWRPLDSPALGVSCDLSVDPTDARDVFLLASSCPACTPALPLGLYRTRDGGRDWAAWPLPPYPSGDTYGVAALRWTWAGSAFFISLDVFGPSGSTGLVASVAGRPFRWLDGGLFAGQPPDASISSLVATRTALYVLLSTPTECPPECGRVLLSRDLGSVWSPFAPTFRGHVVYLLQDQVSADGATLFGMILAGGGWDDPLAARTYVRSSDDGASWEPLPAPPGHLLIFRLYDPPDRRIYADLDDGVEPRSLPPGVYALAAGAAAWTFVAPQPGGGQGWLAIARDEGGHATALWAGANPPLQPGLEYHTP